MAAPRRSASIDALYRDALAVWPGITVFWIGDLSHQGEVSGHNPDDFPRVQAEQTDSDTIPEVRALDFMIVGTKFTAENARQLVDALIHGADRKRVYYVIYNRHIYRRAAGFRAEAYSGGDPHTNHVHVSGLASDDNNGAPWTSVLALGGDDMPTADEIAQALLKTRFTSPGLGVAAPGWTVADWLKKGEAGRLGVIALQAKVDVLAEVLTKLAAGGTNVDTAAILAGVDERLEAFREKVHADVDDELDEQALAGADPD